MQIVNATVECPHCGHQLQGEARFQLDIISCANCRKFVKLETFARVTRMQPKRTIEQYVDVVDTPEV
ncbi:MAG TPA: hypothetical protein VFA38_01250 [Nitrospirales bacterium]|nr:hypothetical protein [Nitrospirales bacterium]